MKDSKLKNWPMPQAVKNENWGLTGGGTTDNKINDRKSGIDAMEKHNAKITKRQTPKKVGLNMGVALELSGDVVVPKRETAGTKIQKFLDSQKGDQYEAGDILKPIFRDLENVILNIRKENKNIPEYYIVTHSQKNPFLGGALHIRTFWRKTRPSPGYNFDCYKVINPGDQFEFQWSVPSEAVCRAILAKPQNYDPLLAKCVVEFSEGRLV